MEEKEARAENASLRARTVQILCVQMARVPTVLPDRRLAQLETHLCAAMGMKRLLVMMVLSHNVQMVRVQTVPPNLRLAQLAARQCAVTGVNQSAKKEGKIVTAVVSSAALV